MTEFLLALAKFLYLKENFFSTAELWVATASVGSNMKSDGAGRCSCFEQICEMVETSQDFVRLTVYKYLLSLWLS